MLDSVDEVLVAGRLRKQRPRLPLLGYVLWQPGSVHKLLQDTLGVLDAYAQYLPLSIRQCFYLLVSRGYQKTEKFYRHLIYVFNRGRRARLIPWDAVRDDTVSVYSEDWYTNMDGFLAETQTRARSYTVDKLADQKVVVEVQLEAAGMGPQVFDMVSPYSVRVYPAGGFQHLTPKHHLVERIVSRYEKQTVVLSLGDWDPSGVSMFDNLAADISAFVREEKRPITPMPIFRRVALTEEQVVQYHLETAPPTFTDPRTKGWGRRATCQLEAMPPDVLRAVLTAAIEEHLDLKKFREAVARERVERRLLVRSLPAAR